MEEKKQLEEMTEFAQMMQAENNKLLQAMSDEQLCEIVSNCIDELDKREYSVLVSISNPDSEESAIYMTCFGLPRHLAAGLMYLAIKNNLFADVVSVAADKLANEREFYEKAIAEYDLEFDEIIGDDEEETDE